jgi:hypothetical protein
VDLPGQEVEVVEAEEVEAEAEVAVEATEVQLLSTYSLDMSLSSHSFP